MQRYLAWAGGMILGLGLVFFAQPARAVITRLTPLSEVLQVYPLIFSAKVDALDPERPSVVLLADEDLKGKAQFRRLPINLKGDSEAEKEKHTQQLLKRLNRDLPLILFVSQRGKQYTAFAYTNGTWFQMRGQKADDDDAVRWTFTHCEPYLRRTFKDSTAELRQVVIDGLAGKKKPPEPDPKEKPGLGPEVKSGDATPDKPEQASLSTGPPFAVIPTVLVGGPLMILALLFPAVFGGLTLFFRRWLVVLSIISINSTIWVLQEWCEPWLHDSWWGTTQALWVSMTLMTLVGLIWSWRKHTATVREEAFLAALVAAETDPLAPPTQEPAPASMPGRREQIFLWALSLLGVVVVTLCLLWRAPLLDSSWRKPLLVMWVGVWTGTLYTLWLPLAASRGATVGLSAEGVMLSAMALASVGLGLTTVPRSGAVSGDFQAHADEEAATDGANANGVVWRFEAKDRGTIASSPLIVGNRVYIGVAHSAAFDTFGRLYCLDRATGKEVWTFDDDGGMKQIFSTPYLADDCIYIGEGFHQDRSCKLYCLEAATGKKRWEFATSSHTESSPVVAGDKVYFGAGDDGVFCVTAADGKEVWHYPGLHVDCTPAVIGGRVYAGSGVGDLHQETCLFCLEADGSKVTEVWRVPTNLPVWGSPTVKAGNVFYGLGNGNFVQSDERPGGAVICLDAVSGRRLWQSDVPDAVLNRPAVDRNRVYFGSRDGNCYCVERRDGRLRWKHNLGSPIVTAPVLARIPGASAYTSLYAISSAGQVCCLDPDSGLTDWVLDLKKEAPTEAFSSPAVIVSRDAVGERRFLYFGVGLKSPLGSTAVLYCHEDHFPMHEGWPTDFVP